MIAVPDRTLSVAKSYCLDLAPVTTADYSALIGTSGVTAPTQGWVDPAVVGVRDCNYRDSARQNHPINCVSSVQAAAYCAAVGKRLPSEAEYQWAQSNGGTTIYPWGDTAPNSSTVCAGRYQTAPEVDLGTCPVASLSGGTTVRWSAPIFDLSGNVWEWTSSKYETSPSQVHIRGGSWRTDYAATPQDHPEVPTLFAAAWTTFESYDQLGRADLGFRCARDP